MAAQSFTPHPLYPTVKYHVVKWRAFGYELAIGYASGDGPASWFPLKFYRTDWPGHCWWFWRVGCGYRACRE